MKRGRYFFIAFLSAALSFGLLTAFVNPKYSGMQYGCNPHWGWHRGYYDGYNPYPNYPPPYAYPDSGRRYYQQPQNSQHQ